MSVRLTYFVHGTTTDNEQHIATGWLPGALSETGKEQSIALGEQLADKKYDVVITSDLARAVASADLMFGDRFLRQEDARLRECNYGDRNGTVGSDFKDRLEEFITTPFPNGESYSDVEERMRAFVDALLQDFDGKQVAVVAHQAPQLALDVIVHGRTWEEAIAEDWRKVKAWKPGWEYLLS